MNKLGKYEILEEIGRGGFATVYKAHDTQVGRDVALKVLHGVPADEAAFVQRFQQEARIAANLRHPNIVTIYDFGQSEDGMLYLAMALIGQGRTLRNVLDEQGPLSLEQALPILAPLADALNYLHRSTPPLAHRDIKPANILMEGEGDRLEVILTDFGLVRSMEASTQLTRSGTTLGTPAYMAPEQTNPERWGEITPLTDVYALGVVAYEMLVGRQPFLGELATVLHAHAYEEPPSPLEIVPDLGDDLAEVLTTALAKPPMERYPSAGELVDALRQVAETRARQEAQQTELEQLLAQARAAGDAGDWLAVQDFCVQAMQVDRMDPDALEMMAEATAGLQRESAEEAIRRKRAQQYEEGEQALARGQWQTAIEAFEEVAAGNPDFRDVQDKLVQARDELRREEWYNEAIAHGEAGHWVNACRAWLNVLRGRVDYRDLDAAKRLLEATEGLVGQYEQALGLFDELAAAVENEEWDSVVKAGERLLRLAPDLDRPQVWLARAEAEAEARLAAIMGPSIEAETPMTEAVLEEAITAPEEAIAPPEEIITAPVEIPEWLQEIAPPEAAPPTVEAAPEERIEAPVEVAEWPQEIPPQEAEELAPDWLEDEDGSVIEAPVEVPEWLQVIAPPKAAPPTVEPAPPMAEAMPEEPVAAPAAVPEWLEAIAPPEAAPEVALAPPAEEPIVVEEEAIALWAEEPVAVAEEALPVAEELIVVEEEPIAVAEEAPPVVEAVPEEVVTPPDDESIVVAEEDE